MPEKKQHIYLENISIETQKIVFLYDVYTCSCSDLRSREFGSMKDSRGGESWILVSVPALINTPASFSENTVKILKFGTPQTIAIIVLKIEKFDVTLH